MKVGEEGESLTRPLDLHNLRLQSNPHTVNHDLNMM